MASFQRCELLMKASFFTLNKQVEGQRGSNNVQFVFLSWELKNARSIPLQGFFLRQR